jgi:hypothetical protein
MMIAYIRFHLNIHEISFEINFKFDLNLISLNWAVAMERRPPNKVVRASTSETADPVLVSDILSGTRLEMLKVPLQREF